MTGVYIRVYIYMGVYIYYIYIHIYILCIYICEYIYTGIYTRIKYASTNALYNFSFSMKIVSLLINLWNLSNQTKSVISLRETQHYMLTYNNEEVPKQIFVW